MKKVCLLTLILAIAVTIIFRSKGEAEGPVTGDDKVRVSRVKVNGKKKTMWAYLDSRSWKPAKFMPKLDLSRIEIDGYKQAPGIGDPRDPIALPRDDYSIAFFKKDTMVAFCVFQAQAQWWPAPSLPTDRLISVKILKAKPHFSKDDNVLVIDDLEDGYEIIFQIQPQP